LHSTTSVPVKAPTSPWVSKVKPIVPLPPAPGLPETGRPHSGSRPSRHGHARNRQGLRRAHVLDPIRERLHRRGFGQVPQRGHAGDPQVRILTATARIAPLPPSRMAVNCSSVRTSSKKKTLSSDPAQPSSRLSGRRLPTATVAWPPPKLAGCSTPRARRDREGVQVHIQRHLAGRVVVRHGQEGPVVHAARVGPPGGGSPVPMNAT